MPRYIFIDRKSGKYAGDTEEVSPGEHFADPVAAAKSPRRRNGGTKVRGLSSGRPRKQGCGVRRLYRSTRLQVHHTRRRLAATKLPGLLDQTRMHDVTSLARG